MRVYPTRRAIKMKLYKVYEINFLDMDVEVKYYRSKDAADEYFASRAKKTSNRVIVETIETED